MQKNKAGDKEKRKGERAYCIKIEFFQKAAAHGEFIKEQKKGKAVKAAIHKTNAYPPETG